jgi:hypothetical protein
MQAQQARRLQQDMGMHLEAMRLCVFIVLSCAMLLWRIQAIVKCHTVLIVARLACVRIF